MSGYETITIYPNIGGPDCSLADMPFVIPGVSQEDFHLFVQWLKAVFGVAENGIDQGGNPAVEKEIGCFQCPGYDPESGNFPHLVSTSFSHHAPVHRTHDTTGWKEAPLIGPMCFVLTCPARSIPRHSSQAPLPCAEPKPITLTY